MTLLKKAAQELAPPPSVLKKGDSGPYVKRVQEWLCLRGYGVRIDSDFGPATEAALKRHFGPTGVVDQEVWELLTRPMWTASQIVNLRDRTMGEVAAAYAEYHLKSAPREVGGENRGPWVRLYMDGHEGAPWAWCAGFVSTIYQQASEDLGIAKPFQLTYSCDQLAAQAKVRNKFMTGGSHASMALQVGSLFLVRKSATDWMHTGIVTRVFDTHFDTIEGNTNDDGSREGYEVCARTRGYNNVDFFVLF